MLFPRHTRVPHAQRGPKRDRVDRGVSVYYRLGNRSALEWVIDQYRVSTDPRSGIVNDPNRPNDPHYILRLIGQVITVSLETQRMIATLPSLNFPT